MDNPLRPHRLRHLPLVCIMALLLLLSACGQSPAKSAALPTSVPAATSTPTATPTPAVQPTQPPSPILQSYYLYTSSTTIIFLNFMDGKDERASTTSQDNVYGKPCLMTYEDGYMTYTQDGNRITIQALYVSHTPLTVSRDGTLTTNETDNSGKIIIENYKPSSIQAYNAALAQLGKNVPRC
jgi:ABC-type uncharacterized transport system auxiliary subunit